MPSGLETGASVYATSATHGLRSGLDRRRTTAGTVTEECVVLPSVEIRIYI